MKNFSIWLIQPSAFCHTIQEALQRLEEGCGTEEAKAICEPGILQQVFIWQVETSTLNTFSLFTLEM
ncbi:hypothetical protein RJT34_06446 [Clitoria ternatea]|uniref:Uncharacterized protein n=1 Tax=Clitoria ternatea TaxID=43366 RepID=A0AAN9K3F1_CLITE